RIPAFPPPDVPKLLPVVQRRSASSQFDRGTRHEILERLGIFDGVSFHVVVEVNEDVEPMRAPRGSPFSPRLQSPLAVAESLRWQVHPYICEVARDLEHLGHLWMIGDAESDPMHAEHVADRRSQPATGTELERQSWVAG